MEDVTKEEAKRKSDYFLRMEVLLNEAKGVKELKLKEIEKGKLKDVELTKQYAAQLDKADRERKAGLDKLTKYAGRMESMFVE